MRRQDCSSALDESQAAVAETGVKALMPIDRPFLDYVLSAVAEAGCRRVCLVIGPRHDAIRDYYGRGVGAQRLRFEFAVQEEPRGTADAVLAAEAFADGDHFLVINSDNYYPPEALGPLRRQGGSAVALFEREAMLAGSNVPAERLRHFAVGQVDAQGFLERVIEKPDEQTLAALARPLWLSMNCWRFGPAIFEACRAIKPSPRGELEIPSAVQHAIDVLGVPFRVLTVRTPVLDLSSRQDVAPVAEKLAGKQVHL
jgi:glucose-1-phosphate thymidylyltransferase